MKEFNKDKELNKLKHKRNTSVYIKYATFIVSILLFVVSVIFLTRALYTETHEFEIINATVGEFYTDIRIKSIYYDGAEHNTVPAKGTYGATEVNCTNSSAYWDSINWKLIINDIKGKVECSLKFNKGTNFLSYLKGLPNSSTVISQDETTDKNMRFIGSDPNNYVSLPIADGSTELFRVIGVFNSNSHGKSDQNLVKIVKAGSNDYLLFQSYDNINKLYWSGSYLSEKLNSDSYGYNNSPLVESVTWKTGVISYNEANTTSGVSNFYTKERGTTSSNQSSPTTWTGKVALPYISDALYATSGYNGTTRSSCISASPCTYNDIWYTSTNDVSSGPCSRGSWMIEYSIINGSRMWTLSHSNYGGLWLINDIGYPIKIQGSSDSINGTLPSVYLKNNTLCANCNDLTAGSKANPFKIFI